MWIEPKNETQATVIKKYLPAYKGSQGCTNKIEKEVSVQTERFTHNSWKNGPLGIVHQIFFEIVEGVNDVASHDVEAEWKYGQMKLIVFQRGNPFIFRV